MVVPRGSCTSSNALVDVGHSEIERTFAFPSDDVRACFFHHSFSFPLPPFPRRSPKHHHFLTLANSLSAFYHAWWLFSRWNNIISSPKNYEEHSKIIMMNRAIPCGKRFFQQIEKDVSSKIHGTVDTRMPCSWNAQWTAEWWQFVYEVHDIYEVVVRYCLSSTNIGYLSVYIKGMVLVYMERRTCGILYIGWLFGVGVLTTRSSPSRRYDRRISCLVCVCSRDDQPSKVQQNWYIKSHIWEIWQTTTSTSTSITTPTSYPRRK